MQIVMAEMGLKGYRGRDIRSSLAYSGIGTRENRRKYIEYRLGFASTPKRRLSCSMTMATRCCGSTVAAVLLHGRQFLTEPEVFSLMRTVPWPLYGNEIWNIRSGRASSFWNPLAAIQGSASGSLSPIQSYPTIFDAIGLSNGQSRNSHPLFVFWLLRPVVISFR